MARLHLARRVLLSAGRDGRRLALRATRRRPPDRGSDEALRIPQHRPESHDRPDLRRRRRSEDPSVWYVAAAAGNLWKTENRGNTWTAVFDEQGSYSLGAVTVDPKDSNVVWLGTGENNNQRSVSFGDGVYKSTDAGATWKRMGLENSEHIQNIVIDPRTQTSSTSLRLGRCGHRAGTAGSTSPPTAGRRGRRCSASAPTLA